MNILTTYRRVRKETLKQAGLRLGIHFTTMRQWETKRVPAERVLDVEAEFGIPRHEIRPDIYPAPLRGKRRRAPEQAGVAV